MQGSWGIRSRESEEGEQWVKIKQAKKKKKKRIREGKSRYSGFYTSLLTFRWVHLSWTLILICGFFFKLQ